VSSIAEEKQAYEDKLRKIDIIESEINSILEETKTVKK
jgi:hypothetical protein